MKRIILSTLIAACGVLGMMAQAQATFKNRNHDFGVIKENGGPVSHTFEFTNTGDKPLIIVEATASCGCTRPEYTTKPIKPGKKGKIKVTYSPLGRPGAFRKNVKIKTNGQPQRVTLFIEGTATPEAKKKK